MYNIKSKANSKITKQTTAANESTKETELSHKNYSLNPTEGSETIQGNKEHMGQIENQQTKIDLNLTISMSTLSINNLNPK